MSQDSVTELDLPDGILDADQAVEVLRAWVADGNLHVICDPETFGENASEWGRLLGDISRHIANALSMDGEMSEAEALAKIHEAFRANIGGPTPNMAGRIKGRTQH